MWIKFLMHYFGSMLRRWEGRGQLPSKEGRRVTNTTKCTDNFASLYDEVIILQEVKICKKSDLW